MRWMLVGLRIIVIKIVIVNKCLGRLFVCEDRSGCVYVCACMKNGFKIILFKIFFKLMNC